MRMQAKVNADSGLIRMISVAAVNFIACPIAMIVAIIRAPID